MPEPQRARTPPKAAEAAAVPFALQLTPDQVALLRFALLVAIESNHKAAEAARRKAGEGRTIRARREAHAAALDLTADARKLDQMRQSLPE